MDQKELWEHLAKENSRYYINTDKGRGITEEQFRESGEMDCIRHLDTDVLILGKSPLKEKVIVEIGCGIGRMTEFMAQRYKKVVGTDISAEMIRQGKRRLTGIANTELFETDGESIPLPDSSVDIVFSYLVFQHIRSKVMIENSFKEVYRVLKKDGLFKVRIRSEKDASMDSWWAGASYTKKEAWKLCASTGFFVIKTEVVKTYGLWLWLKK